MTLLSKTLKLPVIGRMPQFNTALKAFTCITLLALATACSSAGSKPDINLPTNSSAYNRPILAGDMKSAVNQYVDRKFGCKDWELSNVQKSVAFGQLVFTSEGQLFKGEITEIWGVNSCGESLVLRLRAEPSPEGSSLIRIRQLSD